MEPGSRWARSCCESQQSEQERSLTPLLTRVGPARRYAVVLRAGVGVIRPGSTYRGGAQQHGPREAAPHRTTNGTARGRGAPIGFCTMFIRRRLDKST